MEVVTKSPNWTTESWTKTDDEPIRTKPDKNSPKKDHQPLRPVGVVKPNMAEIPSTNQEASEDAMAVTEKSPKSSLPAVMDEIKKAEDNDINDVKGMVLNYSRWYTFERSPESIGFSLPIHPSMYHRAGFVRIFHNRNNNSKTIKSPFKYQ